MNDYDILHHYTAPSGNWYSIEMEVNTNEIYDGVDHCYAFGKVNGETIFSYDDFRCPTFSNNYGDISHDNMLPYLGGYHKIVSTDHGTVGNLRFEWLEGVQPNEGLISNKEDTPGEHFITY